MQELIKRLYMIGAVKIGEFVLTSGLKSPFYIDLRRIYSYPDIVDEIILEIISKTPLEDIDMFVGVATAGIPLATYLACKTRKALGYVRIERKEHGTQSQVEGHVKNRRIAVVDDVATTGGSLERSVEAIKTEGGYPVKALVVIDRGQGARERLKKIGVSLYSLLSAEDLFKILHSMNYINKETLNKILRYIEETRSLS